MIAGGTLGTEPKLESNVVRCTRECSLRAKEAKKRTEGVARRGKKDRQILSCAKNTPADKKRGFLAKWLPAFS